MPRPYGLTYNDSGDMKLLIAIQRFFFSSLIS